MNREVSIKKITKEELLDKAQDNAEELFRSGTFFCSESVVQTDRKSVV